MTSTREHLDNFQIAGLTYYEAALCFGQQAKSVRK